MIAAKLALEDNDVGVMEGAALAEGGEAWDGAVAKGGGGGIRVVKFPLIFVFLLNLIK